MTTTETTAKTETIMVSNDDKVKSQLLDLIQSKKWDSLTEIVKLDKSVASTILSAGATVDAGQGSLALHEVCKAQPTLKLVAALIDACPDAVRAKGCWGYLPLHYACTSAANKDIVKALLHAYPGAARTYDDHQSMLPLHLACKWGANPEVITVIMTTYPEAIFMKDASNKIPMDYAEKLHTSSKQAVVSALELGPLFVTASKNAQHRLAVEHRSVIKGMEEAHTTIVQQWTERFEKERQENEQATSELEETRVKLQNVKGVNEALEKQLKDSRERIRNYEARLQELTFLVGAVSVNMTGWDVEDTVRSHKQELLMKESYTEEKKDIDERQY